MQVSLPLCPFSAKSHWAGLNIQFDAREIQSGASLDAIVRNTAESKKSRGLANKALERKKYQHGNCATNLHYFEKASWIVMLRACH